MEPTRYQGRSLLLEAWHAACTVTYFATEDPSLNSLFVLVYWAFDFLQTLAFPLNLHPQLSWASTPLMRSIMSGLSFIQIVPSHAAEADVDFLPTPADSLWAVMTAFVLATFALFGMAVYAHIQPPSVSVLDASQRSAAEGQRAGSGLKQSSQAGNLTGEDVRPMQLLIPMWMLRTIRFVTLLGIHALMIPVTSALLAPLSCQAGSTWLTLGHLRCWEGTHLTFAIISIILLPLWLIWNLVMASCLVNRMPDFSGKHNTMCASHGRVTAAMILVKLVLCLAYTFSSQLSDPWAYILVNIACGAAWLALYLMFLPYFHQRWNQLQAAFACCFLAGAGSAALQQGIHLTDNDSGAVAFLCLLPMVAYIGYSLAEMRFRSFHARRELTSPFAVELRLRYIVQEAAEQLGHGYDVLKTFVDVQSKDAFAVDSDGPKGRLATLKRKEEEQSLVANGESEHVVQSTVNQIDAIVRDAAAAFGTSAIMNVFLAQYVGTYKLNRHLERVYLRLAEARADQLSFDCRWFAFVRNVQFQQDDADYAKTSAHSSAASRMTVAQRMQYERLLELSRAQVHETRAMVLSFWEQLSSKRPDLKRLQSTGVSITAALAETDASFQRLLELAPQSASLMRLYADFLLELANDPAKGRELLTDAETIEDEQSRVHAGGNIADTEVPFGGLTDFDLSAETLALVRVSAEPGKIGVILDCNVSFVKATGYNRRELIGREMSFLVPEPIGSVHPMFLDRYQNTGVERVVNRSRSLFIAHRSGYLVPAKVNIRPTGDSFVAVLEPIVSPASYLFFLGEAEGWRLSAACKNALSTLNIASHTFKTGSMSMNDYMSDVSADVERLLAAGEALAVALGHHQVSAKVQAISVPHLPTPLYIMRYRIISTNSIEESASGVQDDGDDSSEGASDRASGSGSEDAPPSPKAAAAMRRTGASAAATRGSQQSQRLGSSALKSHPPVDADADVALCPVMGPRTSSSSQRSGSGSGAASTSKPRPTNGALGMSLPGSVISDGPSNSMAGTGSGPDQFSGVGIETLPSPAWLSQSGDPVGTMVRDTAEHSAAQPSGEESVAMPTQSSNGIPVHSALKRKLTFTKPRPQPVRFSGGEGDAAPPDHVGVSVEQLASRVDSAVLNAHVATVATSHSGRELTVGADGEETQKARKPPPPGSVRSSGTSQSSASEVLRRGVMTRQAKLEISLSLLKRALVFVFSVIAALNVAAVSVTTSLFRQMEHNVDVVVMNGDRALFMNRAYAHLQSLMFAAEDKFVIPEGTEYVQEKVERWTSKFESLHRQLYLAVDPEFPEEVDLYTSSNIMIEDLIPGTYVDVTHYQVTERAVSLVNAGLEMVAKLRLANALAPENITMDRNAVFFIMDNGHLDVRQALNKSLMLADARSRTHADSVLLANIVVCAVAEIMLVAIVVFIVVPSVKEVIRSKNMIFFTFLEVPLPVVRALRGRVQRRIEAAQRAAENEDVAVELAVADDDYDEHDADLKAGAAAAAGALTGSYHTDPDTRTQTGSAVPSVRTLDHHGSSQTMLTGSTRYVGGRSAAANRKRDCWNCCFCGKDPSLQEQAVTRKGRSKRKYSNQRTSSFTVLLGMVWPLSLVMVYFGGTFAWKQSVVEEVKYVRDEILWTMQQRFFLGEVNYYLRDAYAYCDPEYVAAALNRTEHAMDNMEFLTDGLMYGSKVMHLRAGVQFSPALAQIAMVNGCVDHVGEYYNMSQCERTFYEGLFGKGMMQGFKEFTADVRLLTLQRRAALAQDPTGMSLCADPLASGDHRHPLNNELIDAVDQMRWRYLAAVTNAASAIRLADAHAVFDVFASYDLGLTLSCIAALSLFYSFVYAPLIRRLDKEIKEVRHLLLLFPDEVSRAVPAILEVGKALLRDDSSVASSQLP